MGREGDSRGTTQVPRQKAGHFVLTNISLPCNAGIAVRTTLHFTQTAREGTSTDFGRVQFHRLLCTSLAASANLLSSVTAFFINGFACYALLSAKTGQCQG